MAEFNPQRGLRNVFDDSPTLENIYYNSPEEAELAYAANREARLPSDSLSRGIAQGGHQAAGMLKAAGSALLDPFAPERAKGLREAALRDMEYAQDVPLRVQTTDQIRGLGDLGSYIAGQFGTMIPQVGASLGAGTLGTLVAGPVGGLVGMYGANLGMTAGEHAMTLYNDPEVMANTTAGERLANVAAYAAPAAALDTVAEKLLMVRLAGGGASALRQGVRPAARHLTKAIPEAAITEGLPEMGQAALSQYMHGRLNPNRDSSKDAEDLKESFFSGWAGGIGMSGVGRGAQVARVNAPPVIDWAGRQVDAATDWAGRQVDAAKTWARDTYDNISDTLSDTFMGARNYATKARSDLVDALRPADIPADLHTASDEEVFAWMDAEDLRRDEAARKLAEDILQNSAGAKLRRAANDYMQKAAQGVKDAWVDFTNIVTAERDKQGRSDAADRFTISAGVSAARMVPSERALSALRDALSTRLSDDELSALYSAAREGLRNPKHGTAWEALEDALGGRADAMTMLQSVSESLPPNERVDFRSLLDTREAQVTSEVDLINSNLNQHHTPLNKAEASALSLRLRNMMNTYGSMSPEQQAQFDTNLDDLFGDRADTVLEMLSERERALIEQDTLFDEYEGMDEREIAEYESDGEGFNTGFGTMDAGVGFIGTRKVDPNQGDAGNAKGANRHGGFFRLYDPDKADREEQRMQESIAYAQAQGLRVELLDPLQYIAETGAPAEEVARELNTTVDKLEGHRARIIMTTQPGLVRDEADVSLEQLVAMDQKEADIAPRRAVSADEAQQVREVLRMEPAERFRTLRAMGHGHAAKVVDAGGKGFFVEYDMGTGDAGVIEVKIKGRNKPLRIRAQDLIKQQRKGGLQTESESDPAARFSSAVAALINHLSTKKDPDKLIERIQVKDAFGRRRNLTVPGEPYKKGERFNPADTFRGLSKYFSLINSKTGNLRLGDEVSRVGRGAGMETDQGAAERIQFEISDLETALNKKKGGEKIPTPDDRDLYLRRNEINRRLTTLREKIDSAGRRNLPAKGRPGSLSKPHTLPMKFIIGDLNNLRPELRDKYKPVDGIASLIPSGDRQATTRRLPEGVSAGHYIRFDGVEGVEGVYRVTGIGKPDLATEQGLENWSKKEGWSVEAGKKLRKSLPASAVQISFERTDAQVAQGGALETVPTLTRALLRQNPDTIYVFGDNVERKGLGGQAKAARGEPNAFGIPTKYEPSLRETAYFGQDTAREKQIITESIDQLIELKRQGKRIVFPEAGIGTGLAALDKRAPEVAQHLKNELQRFAETTSPNTLNVWHSTGENAGLSNLSPRKFEHDGRTYFSVEHAYQTLKSGEFDGETYTKYKEGGSRKIRGGKPARIKADYNQKLMKDLVKASFEQNPDALQTLLDTGDKTITHTQDKGIWAEHFPRILMEVRGELARSTDAGVGGKTEAPKATPQEPTTPLPASPLKVSEFPQSGYRGRTKHNADAAGVTVAIARDFSTGGERLTKSVAGDKYIHFKFDESPESVGKKLADFMASRNTTTLNVAGNGIHTLSKHGDTQQSVNRYMYAIIAAAHAKRPIAKIVSGGQTGVDLAGAVAAQALGIPADITLPKGFVQRDANGVDSNKSVAEIEKQIKEGARDVLRDREIPEDKRRQLDELNKQLEEITAEIERSDNIDNEIAELRAKENPTEDDTKLLADLLAQRDTRLDARIEQLRAELDELIGPDAEGQGRGTVLALKVGEEREYGMSPDEQAKRDQLVRLDKDRGDRLYDEDTGDRLADARTSVRKKLDTPSTTEGKTLSELAGVAQKVTSFPRGWVKKGATKAYLNALGVVNDAIRLVHPAYLYDLVRARGLLAEGTQLGRDGRNSERDELLLHFIDPAVENSLSGHIHSSSDRAVNERLNNLLGVINKEIDLPDKPDSRPNNAPMFVRVAMRDVMDTLIASSRTSDADKVALTVARKTGPGQVAWFADNTTGIGLRARDMLVERLSARALKNKGDLASRKRGDVAQSVRDRKEQPQVPAPANPRARKEKRTENLPPEAPAFARLREREKLNAADLVLAPVSVKKTTFGAVSYTPSIRPAEPQKTAFPTKAEDRRSLVTELVKKGVAHAVNQLSQFSDKQLEKVASSIRVLAKNEKLTEFADVLSALESIIAGADRAETVSRLMEAQERAAQTRERAADQPVVKGESPVREMQRRAQERAAEQAAREERRAREQVSREAQKTGEAQNPQKNKESAKKEAPKREAPRKEAPKQDSRKKEGPKTRWQKANAKRRELTQRAMKMLREIREAAVAALKDLPEHLARLADKLEAALARMFSTMTGGAVSGGTTADIYQTVTRQVREAWNALRAKIAEKSAPAVAAIRSMVQRAIVEFQRQTRVTTSTRQARNVALMKTAVDSAHRRYEVGESASIDTNAEVLNELKKTELDVREPTRLEGLLMEELAKVAGEVGLSAELGTLMVMDKGGIYFGVVPSANGFIAKSSILQNLLAGKLSDSQMNKMYRLLVHELVHKADHTGNMPLPNLTSIQRPVFASSGNELLIPSTLLISRVGGHLLNEAVRVYKKGGADGRMLFAYPIFPTYWAAFKQTGTLPSEIAAQVLSAYYAFPDILLAQSQDLYDYAHHVATMIKMHDMAKQAGDRDATKAIADAFAGRTQSKEMQASAQKREVERVARQNAKSGVSAAMGLDLSSLVDSITEMFNKDNIQAGSDRLVSLVKELTWTAQNTLIDSDNGHYEAIGRLFSNETGAKDADMGYLTAKVRKSNIYLNKLAKIVEGVEPLTMSAALKGLQTGKLASGGKVRQVQDQVRALLDEMHDYLTEAETGVPKRKDFFPRVWDPSKIEFDRDRFIELLRRDYLATHGTELMPDDARAIARVLIDNRGAEGVLENAYRVGYTPYMQAAMKRKLTFITSDEFSEFQSQNLVDILARYVTQAVSRAEYSRRFNKDGSKLRKMLRDGYGSELDKAYGSDVWRAAVQKVTGDGANTNADNLINAVRTELSAQARSMNDKRLTQALEAADKGMRDAVRAIRAMEGTLGTSEIEQAGKLKTFVRKITPPLIVYQNVRLLIPSIFSQFMDPVGVLIRGGSMNAALRTFKEGLRGVYAGWRDKQVEHADWDLARKLGVIDSTVMLNSIANMYASVEMKGITRSINDNLFRWNGVEQFSQGNRVGAMLAAIEFLKFHMGRGNRHSERYLAELGLTRGMQYNQDDPKVQEAIVRWAEGALIRPNAALRTTWSSDPHFALFFHMKQFTYAMHKVILERIWHEGKHGNIGPGLAFMLGSVPIMIASDIIRGFATNGGEEPPWLRRAKMGDIIGRGVERAGGLGIFQFGADAMKWGPMELAGPAVEQVTDAVGHMFAGKHEKVARDAIPAINSLRDWIMS